MKPVRSHHLLIADDPALLAAYVQYFDLHGYEARDHEVDECPHPQRLLSAMTVLTAIS